ncbi:hypothetical protein [Leyella lascolaii]|uniref:Lipoprotein n=1 Tax=Leyella lascolaii TaxID=1776379 RepID=A0AAW7JPH5_9BACT|nr:hypothetical protein [Leyella lascolaii]MDN0023427.1 hypothetical protein [Leyella lascolaii]MDN0024790.1 hypothetical protein [Leyella lascolaii]
MKEKFYGFVMLGLAALTSCSSEQSVLDSVKLSDLSNTGCKTSYSAKESRPEFYAEEKEKTPKITITVDNKGVATFHVTDLEYDCNTDKILAQVSSQDDEIKIVIAPFKEDPTLEADCYCRYDVGFKLSNLTFNKYHMKIYFANYYGKYDTASPAYYGTVFFSPNTTFDFDVSYHQ